MAGDPLSPSRFHPVHGLLLVPVRVVLMALGVVRLLKHGDGENHWGLGGLGIGVGKIFNVRTVVLVSSKKEEESGSTSFIVEVENLNVGIRYGN